MVTSEPRLMPRTISGSVVLSKLGSVLMSMGDIATEDHTDTWDLGCKSLVMRLSEGHGVVQARAAAKDHVWAHGLTEARV